MRARRRSASAGNAHLGVLAPAGIVALVLVAVLVAGLFPNTVRSSPQEPVLRASLLSLPGLSSPPAEARVATALAPAPVPLTVVAPPVTAEQLLTATDTTDSAVAALEAAREASAQETNVEVTAEAEQLPLFYRYEVQEGDTVSSIASRFGIESNYIVWNNIDILPDENLLSVGEQLQIPSVAGIIHDVRVEETLIEIAERYEANVDDIVSFVANGIASRDLLTEGATILVPGGRVVPPPAPAIRPTGPSTPTFVQREASDTGFVWPTVDLITSYYGPYHPLGIDINAPIGTPIAAAAAGQIVFVGGDPCCSYGLHIEIKHDETFTTLYGHLADFTVTLGEFVEAGQIIGIGGFTGRSTGPHLHFEIRRNGIYQDPLLYLP